MGIRNADGFRFIDGLSGNYILVEEEKLDQYVDYINCKSIKHVTVMFDWGYKRRDIEFIRKCPNIEYLDLVSPLIEDYSPMYSLIHLKSVRLDHPNSKVDLALVPTLEELYVDHHRNILNLDKCKKLRKLVTSYYNPLNKNLEEFSHLGNLMWLSIYKSTVNSLKGLGNLHRLENIFFYNFSNLQCIDELENISGNLIVLVFDGCKNIENFAYLVKLKNLKVLKLINCGNIPNVKFIKQMPNLKAFVFVDSNIVDGDLSPCIGLEYVGFLSKKHYSHNYKDFPRRELSSEIEALLLLH